MIQDREYRMYIFNMIHDTRYRIRDVKDIYDTGYAVFKRYTGYRIRCPRHRGYTYNPVNPDI